MKINFKNAAAVACCATLALSRAACGGGKTKKGNGNDSSLTYWVQLNPNAATSVSNYGDTPFAKELQKRLNVKIE